MKSDEQPINSFPVSTFNQLTAYSGDCLICYDTNQTIIGLNASAEALYRYAQDEILGKSASILVPAHRRKRDDTWWSAVLKDVRPVKAETERIDKLGRIFPAYVTLWPIKDDEGHVIAAAELTLDFSKHSLLMTALQKERDLLEAILETSNDAILMIDTVRTIITANLQFETFFHVPRYQFINRSVDELVEQLRNGSYVPIGLMNLLMTYANDIYQTAAGDFENATKEKRALVWYSAPVYGNDGTVFGRLYVFRDATREREVDRMKTEFVSLVSHELRTPLSSVKGFTDFILDGDAGPIDAGVREYLEIVKFNTERLMSLINDILDITRIEAGRIELRRDVYSIQGVIEASIRLISPMIQEREQKLEIEIAPNLPAVWVDRDRITQVMTNLISNASKYTPKGGRISIEARLLMNPSESDTSMPADLVTPALLVSVRDTGIGIAPKDQPFLFTRFYRTQQATQQQIAGTGLGLVIVKSLVELHNGHVWLQSELEHGSAFFFSIPLVEGMHELHTDR